MHGTCQFFLTLFFTRLHININTDCIVDLSQFIYVSYTKSLLKEEKLMRDRYKNYLHCNIQNKGQPAERQINVAKNSYFPAQQ